MINYLEKTGRTEDDAIAAALKELGMDRDDVSVEILERPKSGFLGIGAVPAKIRVSWETPDPEPAPAPPVSRAESFEKKAESAPRKAEPTKKSESAKKAAPAKKSEPAAAEEETKDSPRADTAEPKTASAAEKPDSAAAPAEGVEPEDYAAVRSFLSGLLEHMNVQADILISEREGGGITVELSGPGMGAVIGRRGETLDAIQHLTNYAVNHSTDKRLRVSVDAENYRAKREESLTRLAEKMAEKAIKYKRSMALEPMNSYERHVIHTALQNYEGVTTASTGTEPNRRVVVSYVRSEQPAGRRPQSREWA